MGMRRCGQNAVLVASLVVVAACTGNVAGNGLVGVDDGGSGGSGSGGVDGIVGGDSPVVDKTAGAVQMRHLLKREIVQAYLDLLGPTPSVDWKQVDDDSGSASFDNDVDGQTLNTSQVQGYLQVASQAANDVVVIAKVKTLLGCSGTSVDKACMAGFVQDFGLRSYRRPLTADEQSAYMALWATEKDPLLGARQVVRAFLSSPTFLYQPEVGVAADDKPGYVKLTGYERATRLSLLLTGSVPSADLMAQAKSGTLDTAEGVARVASKVVQTPQGQAYLRWFAINWLNVNASVGSPVSTQNLRNDSAQLRKDMAEETLRVFDDFAQPGQRLLGMLTADYTYVTPSLAAIYGVDAPQNGNWTKVSLTGKPRLGIMTHPNMLLASANSGPLSIGRGKFVRERLLCQPIGSPPNNVANFMLGTGSGATSEREALKRHLISPTCSACHDLMDPVGFGFEQYDRIGNYSTATSGGDPLTGAGEVRGDGGFTFTGPVELATKLTSFPLVQACAGEKLATYLLGHVPGEQDAGTVALMTQALANNDLPTAIVAYTRSDAFLYRNATTSN